ncbi:MAG TPA: hypothetical protein VMV29_04010 [Ktedonobacterales bacterium]|nr:hypothetical protein [Ktedonobacterales bacterium]
MRGLPQAIEAELVAQSQATDHDKGRHAFTMLLFNYHDFLFHHVFYHILALSRSQQRLETLTPLALKIEEDTLALAWSRLRASMAAVSGLAMGGLHLPADRSFGFLLCGFAQQSLRSAGFDVNSDHLIPWIVPGPTAAAVGSVLLFWRDIVADEQLLQFARTYFTCMARGALQKFPVGAAVDAYLALQRKYWSERPVILGSDILSALTSLPFPEKECCVLSCFFALPHDQIAVILGLAPERVNDAVQSGQALFWKEGMLPDVLDALKWQFASVSDDPTV